MNTGDTVTWGGILVRVVSFTGEWASPILTTENSSFAYTFNTPGFYAYRVFGYLPPPPYEPINVINSVYVGTVTVMPWTNTPPLVTLNAPVEGARFRWFRYPGDVIVSAPVPVLATVSAAFGPAKQVEIYSGTNSIGVLTNAPYSMWFRDPPLGTNTLIAKAVGVQGAEAWSKPVTIIHEALPSKKGVPQSRFYPPRIERGKLFVVEYHHPESVGYGLYGIPELKKGWARENLLTRPEGQFVDDVSTNQMRFFLIDQAQ